MACAPDAVYHSHLCRRMGSVHEKCSVSDSRPRDGAVHCRADA